MKKIGNDTAITQVSIIRSQISEVVREAIIEQLKVKDFTQMSVDTKLTPNILRRIHKGSSDFSLDSLVSAYYTFRSLGWLRPSFDLKDFI